MVSARMGTWSLFLLLAMVATLAALATAEELHISPDHLDVGEASPGDIASADLTLLYVGGAAGETAVVEVLDHPEGWPHMLHAIVGGEAVSSSDALEIPLMSGEPASFMLTIVPSDTTGAGSHYVNLYAYVKARPAVESTSTVHIQVTHSRSATLLLADPAQANASVRPGDPVELVLTLTNLGNGWDKYHMSANATGPGSAWVTFWSKGVAQDAWTGQVSSFTTLKVGFTVWVPTSGLLGEHVDLTFSATSATDPASYIPRACATVSCALAGALQVSSLFAETVLDPSRSDDGRSTLTGAIQVDNVGNGADVVLVHGSVTGLTDRGLAALSSDPGQIELDRWSSGTFRISLEVYPGAPAGTHVLELFFGSRDPLVRVTDRVLFQVREAIGISLSCDRPDQTVPLGDLAEFALVATNTGNVRADFHLSFETSPEGWAMELRPSSLSLSQGEAETVVVLVWVSPMEDRALLPGYAIKVVATHPSGSLRVGCDLVVRLEQAYRLEWCAGNRTLTSSEAPYAPSDALGDIPCINPFCEDPDWESTGISVLNLGNVAANFSLSTWSTAPSFELVFSPAAAYLLPGQGMEVTVSMVVGHDVAPGAYIVTMAIHCPDAPSFATRILPLHLSVYCVDVTARSIAVYVGDGRTPVMGSVDVDQAATVMLEATFKNVYQTPVADVRVVLIHVAPSGLTMELENVTIQLASNAYTKVTFNWTAYVTGHHVLTIGARLPDQVRTDNDAVWADVFVHALEGEREEDGGGRLPESPAAFAAMAAAVVAFVLWRVWWGSRGRQRPPKQPRPRRVIALQARPWDGRPEDR